MVLKYGMIGCGMMGQEHLRNIALLSDTDVVAIFEPDAKMRAQASLLVPECTMVRTIEELIAFSALDAIVITTPNYQHVAQLEQIAKTRTIPILCEKPIYTGPKDAARLDQLRKTYGAPIWVAMEYRYMPPIAALIAQAEAVTGGIKMLTIREHRFAFLEKVGDWNRFNTQSGGTLVEKCCHFFDLMRVVLKSDPVQVMASGGQEVNHVDEFYDGQRSDIWDSAYVIVDFASGARAMLELSMFAEGAEYQEHIHAIGPSGKIECFVPGPARFWPAEMGEPPMPHLISSPRHPIGPVRIDVPVDPTLLAAGDHNGSTFYQHQKFRAAVLGDGPVEVNLDDGMWAVAIGIAAQQSAATGRSVTLGARTD